MNKTIQTKKKTAVCLCYLILSLALILFDQWTKHLASLNLKGKASFVILDGVFELTYLENTGMAWGLLAGGRWLFLAGTILILALIVYAFLKAPLTRRYSLLRAVLTVLAAGAVGNLIDRFVNGYVIDFFSFCLINFPIFNVADCYVVVAGIVFVLIFLFYYKDEELAAFVPGFLKKKKDAVGQTEEEKKP